MIKIQDRHDHAWRLVPVSGRQADCPTNVNSINLTRQWATMIVTCRPIRA